MTRLIKIGCWTQGVRLNVVFVHGLGGNAYDTWRRRQGAGQDAEDDKLWPVWLARDTPGLAAWTLAYDAASTNWFGTAMPIQDRATNVLECLLGCRELRGGPIVFVCHSLGGLVVKQVLRAAEGRRAYSAEAQALLDAVKGIVFIATPHTGATHATLFDKLRLIAWPSASTLDLVRNNANLRDLNVWYRNWSGPIRHKVFYEKRGTTAGVIVADDSSDPGLLHVDPVGIDADHLEICKPADASDLIYIRTRDFMTDEIVRGPGSSAGYGTYQASDLPTLPPPRSARFMPIALRLAAISIVGLLLFKGVEAVFFPTDALGAASVEQITGAIRAKSPNLTPTQIERFIDALRQARGEPSFAHAVEEAKKGNTRVAEGIWRQIFENREKEQSKAQREQADAARNLAASAVTNNVAEGLSWYKKATALDPDNMAGWLGVGDAARAGGTLQESNQAYQRYIELARRAGNEREFAVGLRRLGDVQMYQGKPDEALKGYRESFAIAKRLTATDRNNPVWQRDLVVSYGQMGDALVALGNLDEALKSYRDGLSITDRAAASNRSNTAWQRDLALSYGAIGSVLVSQGKLDEALKHHRYSLDIFERLASADPSNSGWQRDLSRLFNEVGDVLVSQGKLEEALKNHMASLAIRKRLAATDPGNTAWQGDLATSYERVGHLLVAQGKLDEALENQRDSFTIRERLAAADRSNVGWQNDLAVSYTRIGDVHVAQRQFDEAFQSYQDGFAIIERLAASDRSTLIWQGNLSVLHDKVGNVLAEQGKLDEALKAYRLSLAICERLAVADRSNARWQKGREHSIGRIGGLAYKFVLDRNFASALEVADLAISLAPGTVWLHMNRAHALVFLGRVDEARALYLRHRGQKDVQGGRPWESVILQNFVELRNAGLAHPLMDEIKERFAAGG